MKTFSKIFKKVGVGTISIAWMFIVIQVLLGVLSNSPFGFFT